MLRKQWTLDVLTIVLIWGGISLYNYELRIYTSAIDKPIFLEIAFFSSLVLGALYEMKAYVNGRSRLVGIMHTIFIFCVGLLAATAMRHEYVDMIKLMQETEGFNEVLGHDLYEAITTRYVGYGGSFAIGIVFSRLVLGRVFIRSYLEKKLVLPSHRPTHCYCCGKAFLVDHDSVVENK